MHNTPSGNRLIAYRYRWSQVVIYCCNSSTFVANRNRLLAFHANRVTCRNGGLQINTIVAHHPRPLHIVTRRLRKSVQITGQVREFNVHIQNKLLYCTPVTGQGNKRRSHAITVFNCKSLWPHKLIPITVDSHMTSHIISDSGRLAVLLQALQEG